MVVRRLSHRFANDAAGCAERLRRCAVRNLDRPRRRARRRALPAGIRATGTAATTASPGATAARRHARRCARRSARHGADRVAVVLGTSTSSIAATEEAYARLDLTASFPGRPARPIVHTPHSLGDFVQHATGLRGPCVTVATACSSSAKVFAQAARLMPPGLRRRAGRRRRHAVRQRAVRLQLAAAGVARAVPSVRLRARAACRWARPAASRCSSATSDAGGRAAARLRRIQRRPPHVHAASRRARARNWRCAMRWRARGIDAGRRSVISTCTAPRPRPTTRSKRGPSPALFPESLHASSTKGWTGHTLGAAGIVESVFALLALEHGVLPGILNSATPDPACGPQIRFDNAQRDDPLRDEQFLRLRRQQLLAGVRRSDRMTRSCGCCTRRSKASVSGRSGLPAGRPRARLRGGRWRPTHRRARRRNCSRRTNAAARRKRSRSRWKWRSPPAKRPGASRGAAVGVRLHPRRPRDHRLHVRHARQRLRAACRRPASTIPCTTPRPATGPSARDAMPHTPRSAPSRPRSQRACSKRRRKWPAVKRRCCTLHSMSRRKALLRPWHRAAACSAWRSCSHRRQSNSVIAASRCRSSRAMQCGRPPRARPPALHRG